MFGRGPGMSDTDDPARRVADRLLDDDLVLPLGERPGFYVGAVRGCAAPWTREAALDDVLAL
jgi:hypothetical protein